MSIDQLVGEISKVLIPALPYLIKGVKLGGQRAAEKLGERSVDQSFDQAKKLWSAIRRKKPSRKFSVAAKELANSPEDQTWRTLLAQELKTLLKADPALVKSMTLLLLADVPEQSVRALKNKNSQVSQTIEKTGKQRVTATENNGLVVRQTIGKKS